MDGQHNHHIRQVWGREPWWYLWKKHRVVLVVFVVSVFLYLFVFLVLGGSHGGICGTNIE